MSKPLSDEKAEIALANAVALMRKYGEVDVHEPISISFPEVKGLLATVRLVHAFLQTMPYEMVEFEDESQQCGIKMWNRVDIMAAFKRHAKATLTNKCPDCGEAMDTHKDGGHSLNERLH